MNLQRVQGHGLPRVGLFGVSLGLKVEPGAVVELTQAVPGARIHQSRLPQLSPGAARSPRLAHFLPAADDGSGPRLNWDIVLYWGCQGKADQDCLINSLLVIKFPGLR